MGLEAIKYREGQLQILDQLQLPHSEVYVPVRTAEDGWHAIKDMKVRGAPAIAIVAVLALASELTTLIEGGKLCTGAEVVANYIRQRLQYLVTSRPTAVNLSDAARKLEHVATEAARQNGSTGKSVAFAFIQSAEDMLAKDLDDNMNIGNFGADWILSHTAKKDSPVVVLTHCNTG